MGEGFDFMFNETATNYSDACEEVAWPTAADNIKFHYIALPILIAVGLVGNVLSITVFSSREMRVVPSTVYLLALAIMHSLYLLAVLFGVELQTLHCWFSPTTATPPVVNRSLFVCASLHCIGSQAAQFSTWIIMFYAADRAMAAFTPMFYKRRCTVRAAVCVTVVTFFITAALTVPLRTAHLLLFAFDSCPIVWDSVYVFTALPGVEWVVMCPVPTIIIITLIVLIIIHMCSARRTSRKRGFLQSPQNDGGGGETADVPVAEVENEDIENAQQTDQSRKHKYPPSDGERNSQLDVILILISVAHIVLRAPMTVYYLHSSIKIDNMEVVRIVGRCCFLLEICCFAVNVLLFILSGNIFREQLKTKCQCGVHEDQCGESSTVQTQPAVKSADI